MIHAILFLFPVVSGPFLPQEDEKTADLTRLRDELEASIDEADSARLGIGRARELLAELDRRIGTGVLEEEEGARASTQVLEALSKVLGEALRQGRSVRHRAEGQVLPGLDALAGKLEKEAELETDQEDQGVLLDLRQQVQEEAESIRSELQRLDGNLETLAGIRREVDRTRGLHARRLEVARLAGSFADVLERLNEAMEALEAEWQVRP